MESQTDGGRKFLGVGAPGATWTLPGRQAAWGQHATACRRHINGRTMPRRQFIKCI